MDGLGGYHADRERQISYDITYMWNLKKYDTNELIYKTETLNRLRGRTYGYQGERVRGRGIDWDFGIDMYTLLDLK